MSDLILPLPTTPDGVDPADHVRARLQAAAREATEVTKKLHLTSVPACLRDRAADTSTGIRALRNVARGLVEREHDDELALLETLAALHAAIEEGDHVFMSSDLRVAFERDLASWEQVEDRALAVGELAGSGFMAFAFNELRNYERLAAVEQRVDVPLMHALMRAIAAGVLRGRATPVTSIDVAHRIDELLMKTIKLHGRIEPDDPFLHLRRASPTAAALWNFTRIALRDDLTASARSSYERARHDALRSIRDDVRVQERRLGALPDFNFAFDVGVALGTVDPILDEQAARHGVDVPRRADAFAWSALFYNELPEP